MSMKENINKALCGGSEVYRALGEAQKALEVQEESSTAKSWKPSERRTYDGGKLLPSRTSR